MILYTAYCGREEQTVERRTEETTAVVRELCKGKY
jgi:hypothetical protein